MYGILESWTHVRVRGDTVARSHRGFPDILFFRTLEKTQSHISICKGFNPINPNKRGIGENLQPLFKTILHHDALS